VAGMERKPTQEPGSLRTDFNSDGNVIRGVVNGKEIASQGSHAKRNFAFVVGGLLLAGAGAGVIETLAQTGVLPEEYGPYSQLGDALGAAWEGYLPEDHQDTE